MIKNLFIVGTGNIVNALGGFVFVLAAAKVLSVSEYGTFALLTSIFILTAKLTELGTTSSFVSFSVKQNRSPFLGLLTLKVGMTILAFLFTLVVLYIYAQFNLTNVVLFFVGFVGYALNDYLFAVFQEKEKFLGTTLVNSLPAGLKLLFGAAIWFEFFKTTGSQVLGIYLLALLASVLIFPLLPSVDLSKNVNLKTDIENLIRLGFPGGFSQMLNLSIPAINGSLLYFTLSTHELGVFTFADKIASIMTLVGLSIFTVLLPKKAKDFKLTNNYSFNQLIPLIVIVIFSVTVIVMTASPVISNLFGQKYVESIFILKILAVTGGVNAVCLFLDNFFFVTESTKKLLGISFVKVTTLAVIGYFACLSYGVAGLAYVNLIVASLFLLVTVIGIKLIRR